MAQATTTMEDVNGQLEKTINDFMGTISDGLSQVGHESLNALINQINYASSFYQHNIKFYTNENAELAKINHELKQENDKMKATIKDLSKEKNWYKNVLICVLIIAFLYYASRK